MAAGSAPVPRSGRASRRLLVLVFAATVPCAAAGAAAAAAAAATPVSPPPPGQTVFTDPAPGDAFADVAAATGLAAWSARWGGTERKQFIVEVIGGGAALVDVDADGYLDAYLTTGQEQVAVLLANGDETAATGPAAVPAAGGAAARVTAAATPAGTVPRANALFRGGPGRRFALVPEHSGARLVGWYHGIAAADFDDDGYLDLYVTAFGANALLRNLGDGTFEEVAAAAGVATPGFGTGAAWADFDRDGLLDLATTNYLVFDTADPPLPGSRPTCRWKEIPVSCGPRGLPHERAFLYRARPDGTFEPAQEEVFGAPAYYGFATAWADLDEDGYPDLYIADDQTDNRLYRNRGGTFEESGLLSGTALNEDGRAEGGMGADWGDVDRDGRLDLFVTNFADETNTLYVQVAPDLFVDRTAAFGLALPSFRTVGWGTGLRDFDADGDLDLFVANGHVYPEVDAYELTDSYRQRDDLYVNGGGRFEQLPAPPGSALAVAQPSRGAAFGDIDGDGDEDILVNVLDGPPRLLENRLPQGNRIEVRLRARGPNRRAVGARVRVTVPGLPLQVGQLSAGHSYLSQSSYALHFGLGGAGEARVQVSWPSGRPRTSVVEAVPAGSIVLLSDDGSHLLRRR